MSYCMDRRTSLNDVRTERKHRLTADSVINSRPTPSVRKQSERTVISVKKRPAPSVRKQSERRMDPEMKKMLLDMVHTKKSFPPNTYYSFKQPQDKIDPALMEELFKKFREENVISTPPILSSVRLKAPQTEEENTRFIEFTTRLYDAYYKRWLTSKDEILIAYLEILLNLKYKTYSKFITQDDVNKISAAETYLFKQYPDAIKEVLTFKNGIGMMKPTRKSKKLVRTK
jgi:hypothetical protein